MKRLIHILSFSFFSYSVFAQTFYNSPIEPELTAPRFQITGGLVASNIDLSRYVNYELIRGFHTSLITHINGSFFISTEYSGFPVHAAPVAWDDIHTHKIDVNAHFSFGMTDSRAHIFALIGIDRHDWVARFTGITDINQLATGLQPGTFTQVKRWGLNAGIGFTQPLYENIGIIGDFRFNCSTPNGTFPLDFSGKENKFGIMDVMTTFGITYDIPSFSKSKSNKKKTFGIGKKMYKWTESGGK